MSALCTCLLVFLPLDIRTAVTFVPCSFCRGRWHLIQRMKNWKHWKTMFFRQTSFIEADIGMLQRCRVSLVRLSSTQHFFLSQLVHRAVTYVTFGRRSKIELAALSHNGVATPSPVARSSCKQIGLGAIDEMLRSRYSNSVR